MMIEKRLARVLIALFAVTFTLLLKSLPAYAETTSWEHFGAAPYAASIEEGCRKAPEAIDGFSLPTEVKAAFKASVGTTCATSGKVEFFTPGERLTQMWTGGANPHILDNVEVAAVPVTHSPDGRAYRKDAVVEALKTFTWNTTFAGKRYVLVLPVVCSNWSWYSVTLPPAPVAQATALTASSATTRPSQFMPVGAPIPKCPDVYFLKVNVWPYEALSLPGVSDTHDKSVAGRGDFSKVDHTSRRHGQMFRDALKAGKLARSKVPHLLRVSLIMTPEATGGDQSIIKEEVLGDISVTGLYELTFTKAQLTQWDAIRIVSVNGDFESPPRFKSTGVREVRFFNHLTTDPKGDGVKGEWLNNPVNDCMMNEHWIDSAPPQGTK